MVRSSLGGAALSSTSARYPMYVIPVKALLELDAWEPHSSDLRRRANRDSLLRLPEYGLARRREQEVHA